MSKDTKQLIIFYFCGLILIFLGYFTEHLILLSITYSIGFVWGFLKERTVTMSNEKQWVAEKCGTNIPPNTPKKPSIGNKPKKEFEKYKQALDEITEYILKHHCENCEKDRGRCIGCKTPKEVLDIIDKVKENTQWD